jgi:Predicted Fe-S-cluster oxidoreductase
MKVILDIEGNVNYDEMTVDSTVQDLLDAIDLFLNDNILSCDKCKESCCKTAWSVGVDNISANRLCNWDDKEISDFIQNKLVLKENLLREFDQYVIKKETNCIFVTEGNLCSVYERRPLICRLFMCNPKSHRYNVIREIVAATCLEALVNEEKMRSVPLAQREVNNYRRNPAVFAKDYNILLYDILKFAQEVGWLDEDALEELCQPLQTAKAE